MPCNWRHVPCPKGCGAEVWQFTSKRTGQQYYCDSNQHQNYHECGDEPQETAIEPPVKVKPKPPGVYQFEQGGLEEDEEPKEPESQPLPVHDPDKGIHEGRIVERVEFKEETPFKSAEQELQFQHGFRLLEIRISKGRRVGSETIPELPEYRHFDYFQSRNIAVDNRDMDIKDLIRRQYLEIDTTITEQIAQDRAKVIKALDQSKK